jgi:2-oxoglutarate ferredoxin oxidoreductase subunit gamma
VQTQSYGPESRGGKCRADVIISTRQVDYPEIEHPDVLLVLSQEAANAYAARLRPGGTLIADSGLVTGAPVPARARMFGLPFTQLAQEQLGRVVFANIIALGALVAVTGVVSREAARSAVLARVPKGTEGANQKALEMGFEIGEAATPSEVAVVSRRSIPG